MSEFGSNDKGNLLEAAVELVERAVIQGNKAFKDCDVVITPKKRERIDGVQHEIDLHVAINPGGGYDSVFIFECKNWEPNVGKNEIIIFSEKIRAVNATKGFFVAKGFTKDAMAQAAMDSRLELLIADTAIKSYEYLGFANSFGINMKRSIVRLYGPKDRVVPSPDFTRDIIVLDGVPYPIKAFLDGIGQGFIEMKYSLGSEKKKREELGVPVAYKRFEFDDHPIDQGIYILHDRVSFDYRNRKLVLRGSRVVRVTMEIDHQLEILPPRVHWVCQVGMRGRAARVEYYTPTGPLLIIDVASNSSGKTSSITLRPPSKTKPNE